MLLNGEKVDSKSGPALEPAQAASLAFSRKMLPTGDESYKYQVEIGYAADMDKANNRSETYTVRRTAPDFPVPTALAGTEKDGTAQLEWAAPDLTVGAMKAITDDASAYTAFSTGLAGSAVFDDYVGDWTMIDNDGVVPFSFTNQGARVDFPNSGRPIGFMVFDPSFLGLEEWAAHSGKQMFVSFASGGAPNDDWMISPRLSGEKQTVKFWARSLTHQYGAESFQFLYSTTDTKLSSFTRVNTVSEVPEQWTEYSFEIPEGARWFAIRCTSDGTFALFVDDITFIPAHPADGLTLSGYNLYRDNEKVNDQPITGTSYLDATAKPEDKPGYVLTAVYADGESRPTAKYVFDFNGLNSFVADGVAVSSADGSIIVSGANGMTVNVSSVDGRTVAHVAGMDVNRISVAAGIYIVKAGRKTVKVIVR